MVESHNLEVKKRNEKRHGDRERGKGEGWREAGKEGGENRQRIVLSWSPQIF